MAHPEDSNCDCFQIKFGSDWSKVNTDLQSNFRTWGYNSLGYGGHVSTRKLLPHFASSSPSGKISTWMQKQVEFPDVFSDSWKQGATKELKRMAKNYDASSPNLIGIYWNDMPAWDLEYSKRRTGKTWMEAIRELPEDAPGNVRYERFLLENGSSASDEEFMVLIAREVYSHIGPLTRELFPDTLIFGDRYAGVALPWEVIQEALPWIDVVSVQPNSTIFPAESFKRLYRETRKPVMICDHGMSFNTPEHSNVMWETLPDVASVGKSYERYLKEGFSTSLLIGYNRCQYIDRFKGGQKILKQGLLQVDGKPYPCLVDAIQKVNWGLHKKMGTD